MIDRTLLKITLLLGFTNFLIETSSEMIMPIFPFFISNLGGTGLVVGLIAGTLWQFIGPYATFFFSSACKFLAAVCSC